MAEARSIKLDLAALALLALCVFLGMALATYNRADSFDGLVYPAPAKTTNACGRSGAIAAEFLLQGFGVGAFYLVGSLALLDAWLLARRPVTQGALRAMGWLSSLLAMCTLVALVEPSWSLGPVIGPGGYVGAAGRGLLEIHFASAGAYILTLSLLVGGLLVCTEYLLPRLFAGALTAPAVMWRRMRLAGAMSAAEKAARRSERTDLDDDERDENEPAIKIGGKRTTKPAVEEDEEEPAEVDADDAQEDESEVAEPAAQAGAPAAGTPAREPRFKRPRKSEREEVMQELDAASRTEEADEYELPSIDLLLQGEEISYEEHEKEVRRQAKILEKTFADFGFKVKVVEIETGPVIAQFEVELEAGLRLSKITSLADDLAIALRVPSVRIVAPIPGKNTVGIEVPNSERHLVRIREVIEEANGKSAKMRIPIFLGKDVSGKPMVVDMSTMPHLLDRRPHRHGQERVPQLDHHLDAHDAPPGRSADADDRPQDGRAQPLQEAAALDAPGGHRHAQGRGDPGLGGGKDGGALRPAGSGRRAAHRLVQPVGATKS